MQPRAPWEYHPDLTDERLQDVARFFGRTAQEVATLHSPNEGDDSWSLGCRRNSWWRNRMLMIAQTGKWPWFGVLSPTKAFVFTIGTVPLRFYRGQPDRPPQRTLASRHDELRQLSLAFGDSDLGELKWRFSIETGPTGFPYTISFVGHASDGSVACYWPIPFRAVVEDIGDEGYKPPVAVDIPAPTVASPLGSIQKSS